MSWLRLVRCAFIDSGRKSSRLDFATDAAKVQYGLAIQGDHEDVYIGVAMPFCYISFRFRGPSTVSRHRAWRRP